MVAHYRHNYPIDAFDGWWLSMEPHHTFSAHSAEMENVSRGVYWNPHRAPCRGRPNYARRWAPKPRRWAVSLAPIQGPSASACRSYFLLATTHYPLPTTSLCRSSLASHMTSRDHVSSVLTCLHMTSNNRTCPHDDPCMPLCAFIWSHMPTRTFTWRLAFGCGSPGYRRT